MIAHKDIVDVNLVHNVQISLVIAQKTGHKANVLPKPVTKKTFDNLRQIRFIISLGSHRCRVMMKSHAAGALGLIS